MNVYAVTCEQCGNRWRSFAEEQPDFAEYNGCGATTNAVTLIGTRFEP